MSDKKIMIVNALLNVKEKEAFEYYSEHSVPLFKNAGAESIAKHRVEETLIGAEKIHVVSILEFPTRQAIKDVFESEAYKALLPYRDKAFMKLDVFIGN